MGVQKVELDELLAAADFITLHVPFTESTKNILSGSHDDAAVFPELGARQHLYPLKAQCFNDVGVGTAQ